MSKKIKPADLLAKLEHLDARLLNVWLQDEPVLTDEERWDIFATLLESRVGLLKTCRDAGVALTDEMCVPRWLERLSSSRLAIRRREIRHLEEERQLRKKVGVYETVAALQPEEK
ncbi:MAG: hypothetical protein JST16_06800 [Bdellovibrionales bacterium]|nr:hypothetical protein [Bdellovibrionales bacterium]